jgi:putative colanic acid biosynthesis acetyltransferase WcaF
MILKFFGATITGCPFVHSKAWIQVPWHLTMHHRACLGERSVAYSLGRIEIMEAATVAQEVYLCTGTHDFERTDMQLLTQSITIEKNAFIGVRAMILPGVKIGENAIVGAQAVVCKNVPKNEIFAGNPARKISIRKKI